MFERIGHKIKIGINRLGRSVNKTANKLGKKISSSLSKLIGGEHKDLKNIDDETKFYARLSKDVYEDADKRKDWNGYKYDKELSDKRQAIYHHPQKNKTIVSYRGTKDTDDLLTDIELAKGKQRGTARYRHAENIFEKAQQKYKGSKMEATGHSLGSNITSHISKKYNVKGIGFNAGEGLDTIKAHDVYKCNIEKNKPEWCDKLTTHKIGGDPISLLAGGYGKTHTYKSKGLLDSHSIDNFV